MAFADIYVRIFILMPDGNMRGNEYVSVNWTGPSGRRRSGKRLFFIGGVFCNDLVLHVYLYFLPYWSCCRLQSKVSPVEGLEPSASRLSMNLRRQIDAIDCPGIPPQPAEGRRSSRRESISIRFVITTPRGVLITGTAATRRSSFFGIIVTTWRRNTRRPKGLITNDIGWIWIAFVRRGTCFDREREGQRQMKKAAWPETIRLVAFSLLQGKWKI